MAKNKYFTKFINIHIYYYFIKMDLLFNVPFQNRTIQATTTLDYIKNYGCLTI